VSRREEEKMEGLWVSTNLKKQGASVFCACVSDREERKRKERRRKKRRRCRGRLSTKEKKEEKEKKGKKRKSKMDKGHVAGCEWLGGISFYLKPPTYINYNRNQFY
jgi:hypothetical protein